jgi:7-keto-8-aminopelargonate synthetase-like enzyme
LLIDDAHGFGTMGQKVRARMKRRIVLMALTFILAPLQNQWRELGLL